MNKPSNFILYSKIAEFRNGLNFSKGSHGTGCTLIGVADFKEHFSPQYDTLEEINPLGIAKEDDYLKKNDLLFVRSNGNKALVGRSLYIDRDIQALYSGFCIRARLTTDLIDPLFLAYFSKTDFFKSSISHASGTNINNLNQGILGEVKIPLYSKDVQVAITSVLSAIDKKIELNKLICTELDLMAKTLYEYWFVQFDFPDINGKPYKTSGGKMVHNSTLKRDIPAEWEAVSVGKMVEIRTGKEDANFATEDGSFHFFTCGATALRCDQFAFEGKAILLAGNGSFEVKRYEGKFNAYQRTYVLIPANEDLFAPLYFVVNERVKALTSGSRGSIVKFITKGDIEDICIPLPKDRNVEFAKVLNSCFSETSRLYEQNLELTELRDWLLPMLMNGQVKVK